MGYTTKFTGDLRFTRELTASQLAKVASYFAEDCRKHPEWDPPEFASYIDLELTKDFRGLRHDGSEKSSLSPEMVTMLIRLLSRDIPHFGLSGELQAQGDDVEDRWILRMMNWTEAVKIPKPPDGTLVVCPECEHRFFLKDKETL